MIKKILKFILGHRIIAGIIILAIAGGGYFGYKTLKGDEGETRYVLAAVEKGTIVTSISGSGQVSVSDQIDIKPKVSGDIVAIYVKKDQEVKTGQLIAELDSKDAQKTIRDAQVALDNAKTNLNELLSQPDAKSLLQAQNALAQAERDLSDAKENYDQVNIDAERSLATAYDDGYSAVSSNFFKLPGYMQDLKDIMGTEESEQKYVSGYRLILGSDSLFIQKFIDDYRQANDFFEKNFASFRSVSRGDSRDTIYQLIGDSLETAKAIERALESARHMYDAITVQNYKYLAISSYIDKMQPKLESDVSSVYSNVSSLQRIKDNIDDTNKNTPKKIEDAKLSIQSAQEKLDEKKLALDELMAGASSQDIESQRNVVAQKEDALSDAKEKLANCFVRAPFDGIIAEADSNIKKGDSVSSGTVLATLITKQKIAEITLNEVDIAKVKVGQKATITFDAIEDLNMTGQVVEINTLGTVSQGVVTYDVKILFDAQDERIKPGMTISATIITDVKQNVLLVPNSAVKSRGGASYVEMLNEISSDQLLAGAANNAGVTSKTSPLQQTIGVGLSNDSVTEVTEGLNEGDVIVERSISASSGTQTSQSQNQSLFQSVGGRTGGQIPRSSGAQIR